MKKLKLLKDELKEIKEIKEEVKSDYKAKEDEDDQLMAAFVNSKDCLHEIRRIGQSSYIFGGKKIKTKV